MPAPLTFEAGKTRGQEAYHINLQIAAWMIHELHAIGLVFQLVLIDSFDDKNTSIETPTQLNGEGGIRTPVELPQT